MSLEVELSFRPLLEPIAQIPDPVVSALSKSPGSKYISNLPARGLPVDVPSLVCLLIAEIL